MNRFFLLLLIGAITFIVLMFANNPDFFGDIWLYVIGLAGGILKVLSMLHKKLQTFSSDISKAGADQETTTDKNKK